MINFLRSAADQYPDRTQLISVGQTAENRDILALKVYHKYPLTINIPISAPFFHLQYQPNT
ncbi:MAG: M14 family zinc carboxypeptidase [Candidatus Nitrosomaritimum aestuariumsis]